MPASRMCGDQRTLWCWFSLSTFTWNGAQVLRLVQVPWPMEPSCSAGFVLFFFFKIESYVAQTGLEFALSQFLGLLSLLPIAEIAGIFFAILLSSKAFC